MREIGAEYFINPYTSKDFLRGNFSNGDIRKAFRRMYRLMESDQYKQRWLNAGFGEEEVESIIRLQQKFMENVHKARVSQHLLTYPNGGVQEVRNAAGVYSPQQHLVEVLSENAELSDEELSTLIHELFHASDNGKPEVYMRNVEWMTPMGDTPKETVEYYLRPTEQRARGLATLTDMMDKGLSINQLNEYDRLQQHDHNYDDMIKTYGKDQTFRFLRAIYSALLPLFIGTNVVEQ